MAKPIPEMSLDEKCDWVAERALSGLVDGGTSGLKSAAFLIAQGLMVDGRNRGIEDCAKMLEKRAASTGDATLEDAAQQLRGLRT